MKKIYPFLLLLLLCLSGCSPKMLPPEQIQKNCEEYEAKIREVAESYGYTCEESEIKIRPTPPYKTFIIPINENTYISVIIQNNPSNDDTNPERFSVHYIIEAEGYGKETFDTKLFTEVSNIMSGKKLEKDFCDEFLQAPENEYPASAHGFKKLNKEQIAKKYLFNFMGDWAISYYLRANDSQELCFGGYTDQSMTD